MPKKTLVISTFPACGKTWLAKNVDKINIRTGNTTRAEITVKELDSSRYDKTNPAWVAEYAQDVRDNAGKYDFIVVSMQDEFLEELNNEGIPFVTVGPNNADWEEPKTRQLVKQQWFGRFALRDNSHIKDLSAWLDKLKANYDDWTSVEGLTSHSPVSFFLLGQDQYLSDIISELWDKKEHYAEYDAGKVSEVNKNH